MDESRGSVLVVDDEEAIRGGVCRKLQSGGYDCAVASNGEEALEAVSRQDFDLVLLDIRMPGISGMDVLSHVTADHPDTCVVMTTAVNDGRTMIEAMQHGAYDYITKPFTLEALSIRVERALERKRLLQENRDYRLRLAEAALEESEASFKEIFENVSDVIFYIDASGKCLNVNDRSIDMIGLPPDEIVGRSFTDLGVFDREALSRLAELRRESAGRGDTMMPRFEVRARHKDGHEIVAEVSITASEGPDGELKGFLGITRDVTERKRAEDMLKKAHDELELQVYRRTAALAAANKALQTEVTVRKQAEEELKEQRNRLEDRAQERTAEVEKLLSQKDQFISLLGHDLKTPLTSIITLLFIWKRRVQDVESTEVIDVLIKNANYMKELVLKTLQLARLGKIGIEVKNANADLLRGCFRLK
jgi:PAS domain S-box-containing protein